MSKAHTLRVAVGGVEAPYSGVWRVIADRHDVYIGASKAAMGVFKVSLHSSGVWLLAATKQSGAAFQDGNRRAKQWNRPLEHALGITRGPSILVPCTSLGSRKLPASEMEKRIYWHPAPREGEVVELSLYFVRSGVMPSWSEDETVVEKLPLASGHRLFVLASCKPCEQSFLNTVERLLRENVVRFDDVQNFHGGSFLWITQSADHMKIPLLVDLPVATGRKAFSSFGNGSERNP